jgi:hypothetical protein
MIMLRRVLTLSLAFAIAGLVAIPTALGDQVYHSEHLVLASVGNAPLRSGYVENIHPNGPVVFAHEIYVLNGAEPDTTYQVTLSIFSSTSCASGSLLAAIPTAQIETNGSGNGVSDFFIAPEVIGDLHGATVGVMWTVASSTSSYETRCTTVTLD